MLCNHQNETMHPSARLPPTYSDRDMERLMLQMKKVATGYGADDG